MRNEYRPATGATIFYPDRIAYLGDRQMVILEAGGGQYALSMRVSLLGRTLAAVSVTSPLMIDITDVLRETECTGCEIPIDVHYTVLTDVIVGVTEDLQYIVTTAYGLSLPTRTHNTEGVIYSQYGDFLYLAPADGRAYTGDGEEDYTELTQGQPVWLSPFEDETCGEASVRFEFGRWAEGLCRVDWPFEVQALEFTTSSNERFRVVPDRRAHVGTQYYTYYTIFKHWDSEGAEIEELAGDYIACTSRQFDLLSQLVAPSNDLYRTRLAAVRYRNGNRETNVTINGLRTFSVEFNTAGDVPRLVDENGEHPLYRLECSGGYTSVWFLDESVDGGGIGFRLEELDEAVYLQARDLAAGGVSNIADVIYYVFHTAGVSVWRNVYDEEVAGKRYTLATPQCVWQDSQREWARGVGALDCNVNLSFGEGRTYQGRAILTPAPVENYWYVFINGFSWPVFVHARLLDLRHEGTMLTTSFFGVDYNEGSVVTISRALFKSAYCGGFFTERGETERKFAQWLGYWTTITPEGLIYEAYMGWDDLNAVNLRQGLSYGDTLSVDQFLDSLCDGCVYWLNDKEFVWFNSNACEGGRIVGENDRVERGLMGCEDMVDGYSVRVIRPCFDWDCGKDQAVVEFLNIDGNIRYFFGKIVSRKVTPNTETLRRPAIEAWMSGNTFSLPVDKATQQPTVEVSVAFTNIAKEAYFEDLFVSMNTPYLNGRTAVVTDSECVTEETTEDWLVTFLLMQ